MGNRVPGYLARAESVINSLVAGQRKEDVQRYGDLRLNRRFVTILLAANGVSQTEIAKRARVHKSTVTRALQNRRTVTAEKRVAVLLALAERLKCEPLELCRGRAAA